LNLELNCATKENSLDVFLFIFQGSVYQKTQAARDINIKARDKFWAKTEVCLLAN